MTWLDLIMILILGGAAVIQARRGLFQSFLDLVVLVVCAIVAKNYGARVGEMAKLGHAGGILLTFVVLGAAGIAISRLVYNTMPLTIEAWDPLFGAIFGVACGAAAAHVLIVAILTSKGNDYGPVANSALCMQIATVSGWHGFITMMHRLGGYEEPTPEPG